MTIAGEPIKDGHAAFIKEKGKVEIKAGHQQAELLLLQGKPIGEPVVKYGPFVMNTRKEIQEAFSDYQRTQFGGWPWPSSGPVHGQEKKRFARHADGKEDLPG